MARNRTCGVHWALIFATCGPVASAADLRLGIIGTDTSHVIEFTKMLNDVHSSEHITGARVIAAFKGGSSEMPESYKRVDRFANELRTRWKIEFVSDIPSLCPKVDGLMLESVDGRQHLEQVKQAVACGKPLWIDKPLASSLEDANEIVRIMREAGVPWFSASSLRFSRIATSVKSAKLSGAVVWGPGDLGPGQLDLAWYVVHSVELLYAIMGPGCETVNRLHAEASDVITGRWSGGRVGEVRAFRPDGNYGAIVFNDKGIVVSPPDADDSYRPLVMAMVQFFETRRPPVSNAETLETIRFMEAAARSMKSNGAPARLQ